MATAAPIEFRHRQCRGRARRLRRRCQGLGAGEALRQCRNHRQARGQAALIVVARARCRRRRHGRARRRYQGTERALAGASLRVRRQAGDANSRAPLDPHPRQGREPDPDIGPVHGSGAWHRQRLALRRPLHRARCGDHPEGARPLSVRLFGADHEPRHAAALCQRARGRRASGDGYRGRSAHQGCHRSVVGAAGLEWFVRPVVGRRRRCLAGRLCD